VEFQQNIANHDSFNFINYYVEQFAKFQKFQQDNLVDFEKCCRTRFFLSKIGADTAENERNFSAVVAGRVRRRLGLGAVESTGATMEEQLRQELLELQQRSLQRPRQGGNQFPQHPGQLFSDVFKAVTFLSLFRSFHTVVFLP